MSKKPVLTVDDPLDKLIIRHIQDRQQGAMRACCEAYEAIAETVGCCERTLRRHLERLRKRGLLFRCGYAQGRRGKYAVWRALERVRIVVRSFARQVREVADREVSVFLAASDRPSAEALNCGRFSNTNIIYSSLSPRTEAEVWDYATSSGWDFEQQRYLRKALQRWGAAAVWEALDKAARANYSTCKDVMRVAWSLLAAE